MNRPTMGDIRPIKKSITPIKNEQINIENEEPILNIRPKKNENKKEDHSFPFQAKPKRIKEGRKFPKFLLITFFIFIIIYYCLYSFGHVNIVIIPKPDLRQINQLVRLDSWNNPLKVSIMSINEKMELKQDETTEDAKVRLDSKLNNRLIYDMPQGYMLIEKCKSEVSYTKPVSTDVTNKNIEAKMSVLIFEKKSLENYLLKITNAEFTRIKDITKLSCELKSDITKTGTVSKDVSFDLSGDVILLPIIDPAQISQNAVFKTYKNYKYTLDTNTKIATYVISTRPWNIFPVLPRNVKHIHVTVNQ